MAKRAFRRRTKKYITNARRHSVVPAALMNIDFINLR
jgi:hypothetical protein